MVHGFPLTCYVAVMVCHMVSSDISSSVQYSYISIHSNVGYIAINSFCVYLLSSLECLKCEADFAMNPTSIATSMPPEQVCRYSTRSCTGILCIFTKIGLGDQGYRYSIKRLPLQKSPKLLTLLHICQRSVGVRGTQYNSVRSVQRPAGLTLRGGPL